jgi:hypothetical protein
MRSTEPDSAPDSLFLGLRQQGFAKEQHRKSRKRLFQTWIAIWQAPVPRKYPHLATLWRAISWNVLPLGGGPEGDNPARIRAPITRIREVSDKVSEYSSTRFSGNGRFCPGRQYCPLRFPGIIHIWQRYSREGPEQWNRDDVPRYRSVLRGTGAGSSTSIIRIVNTTTGSKIMGWICHE